MVSESTLPPILEAAFRRCRSACEEALDRYGGADSDTGEREFAATLLTVIAAIDTALDSKPGQQERLAAAAAQVARGAAETIRRYGLDEPILRCAAACEELARRYPDSSAGAAAAAAT